MHPDELKYSQEHFWIKVENDNTARIGITVSYGSKLEKIVFIELPEVDTQLTKGERFGSIETEKTIVDMLSPVSGRVMTTNQRLTTKPELVTESPYESGWMSVIELTNTMEVNTFLSAEEYEALVKESSSSES